MILNLSVPNLAHTSKIEVLLIFLRYIFNRYLLVSFRDLVLNYTQCSTMDRNLILLKKKKGSFYLDSLIDLA